MSVILETDSKTTAACKVYAVRRIPRNETPAAKMQRIVRAAVVEYAREHPADLLEIVRQEILDKRK